MHLAPALPSGNNTSGREACGRPVARRAEKKTFASRAVVAVFLQNVVQIFEYTTLRANAICSAANLHKGGAFDGRTAPYTMKERRFCSKGASSRTGGSKTPIAIRTSG